MFRDAVTYSDLSSDYQRETKWVLDKCWHKMGWRSNETILDVGCGSGDVLYHVIRPSLPVDYKSLVGVDISPEMIAYATQKWQDPRLSFELLDICTKEDLFSRFPKYLQEDGGFDKVMSFFCLQWVKDRREMFRNMHTLVRPAGYVFLHLVIRNGCYKLWDYFAKSNKWSNYFNNLEVPFNDYVYMDNSDEVFCREAIDAGFSLEFCEINERKNVFSANTNTDEEMKVRLKSVDPLVSRLPLEMQADYLDEVLDKMKKEVSPRGATDYTGLTVLLRKNQVCT